MSNPTDHRDERDAQTVEGTLLEAADLAFVRRVAEAYTPEPMSATRRVGFVRRLDERLEQSRRRRRARRLWLPVVAAAGAASLAVWLALPGLAPNAPSVTTQAQANGEDVVAAMLALGNASTAATRELSLPDDYAAIESLWLDDGEGA